MNSFILRWIAALAILTSCREAIAAASKLALKVEGVVYSQAVLTSFDGATVGIAHSDGIARIPAKQLTPPQIAALNATSKTVQIDTTKIVSTLAPAAPTTPSPLANTGILPSARTDRARRSPPQYTVTAPGKLAGCANSYAYGINNSGQITGCSNNSLATNHAFLYSDGKMTDLGTLPGGTESGSYAINDSGEVVGYSYIPAGERWYTPHAFLYSEGRMADLGTLGGAESKAYGINNSGQVVGSSYPSGDFLTQGAHQHAFLYSGGKMTDLGTLGGSASHAYGINDSGQITGHSDTAGDKAWHAFLYSRGKMIDIGTLDGGYSDGHGINAAGHVTGSANGYSAFLYFGGKMTDLGSRGGGVSQAYGINVSGDVTGNSTTGDGNTERAFLYTAGKIYDLMDLLVPGSGITNLRIGDRGNSINDRGQIAATAEIAGHKMAIRLDPTP